MSRCAAAPDGPTPSSWCIENAASGFNQLVFLGAVTQQLFCGLYVSMSLNWVSYPFIRLYKLGKNECVSSYQCINNKEHHQEQISPEGTAFFCTAFMLLTHLNLVIRFKTWTSQYKNKLINKNKITEQWFLNFCHIYSTVQPPNTEQNLQKSKASTSV